MRRHGAAGKFLKSLTDLVLSSGKGLALKQLDALAVAALGGHKSVTRPGASKALRISAKWFRFPTAGSVACWPRAHETRRGSVIKLDRHGRKADG